MRVRYLAPVLCVLCACYESVPIELGRVPPGSKIRVSLTDAGADSLARYLGPGVATIDGKLIATTDSGVSLSVSQVAMRSGQDQFWKGETVVIPRYSLSTVQARRINKPKSVLLGGVLIAALATLRLSGVVGGNGGGSGTGIGGKQ
ncbi:MAG TPA: hypothetical protein VIP09_06085 [Dehalococcoidia bacterium]